MSDDPRYETARQHERVIATKLEELNTAIYEAYRYAGYHVSVRVRNATPMGEDRFLGHGSTPVQFDVTVNFDIGKAVL